MGPAARFQRNAEQKASPRSKDDSRQSRTPTIGPMFLRELPAGIVLLVTPLNSLLLYSAVPTGTLRLAAPLQARQPVLALPST